MYYFKQNNSFGAEPLSLSVRCTLSSRTVRSPGWVCVALRYRERRPGSCYSQGAGVCCARHRRKTDVQPEGGELDRKWCLSSLLEDARNICKVFPMERTGQSRSGASVAAWDSCGRARRGGGSEELTSAVCSKGCLLCFKAAWLLTPL